MKHAVIVAHPNPNSVSCQIARAYADAATGLGQESLVRDLYRPAFDPCLRMEEAPGVRGYAMGDDVLRERAQLAGVDVFAFVYPLWFNAPPAMLKGYVDRVFGMGFGYEPDGRGGNATLLDGKRLISFTTSGAPDEWVAETGALEGLTKAFDRHLAAVCGMTVVDHVNFGGVTPGITEDAVEGMLAQVGAVVRRVFDPAASLVS